MVTVQAIEQRIEKQKQEAEEQMERLQAKIDHWNFMLGELRQQVSDIEDEERNERFRQAQSRNEEKERKKKEKVEEKETPPVQSNEISDNARKILEYNDRQKRSSAV